MWTEADELLDDYIGTLLVDRKGALWVGSWNGVSRYDGMNWEGWRIQTAPSSCYGSWRWFTLAEDLDGRLWAGGYGGVCMFDGSE